MVVVILALMASVSVLASYSPEDQRNSYTDEEETGISNQYTTQDDQGKFHFGYDEQHTSGGSFRRETSDGHGRVVGSYGLNDADGRRRIVHYVADDAGFRVQIETNEPGIDGPTLRN